MFFRFSISRKQQNNWFVSFFQIISNYFLCAKSSFLNYRCLSDEHIKNLLKDVVVEIRNSMTLKIRKILFSMLLYHQTNNVWKHCKMCCIKTGFKTKDISYAVVSWINHLFSYCFLTFNVFCETPMLCCLQIHRRAR